MRAFFRTSSHTVAAAFVCVCHGSVEAANVVTLAKLDHAPSVRARDGTMYTLFDGGRVGVYFLRIPAGKQRAFLQTKADTLAIAMRPQEYYSEKVVSTEEGVKRMRLSRGDFFFRPAGMATGGWFVGETQDFDQIFVTFPAAPQEILSEREGRSLVSSDTKVSVIRVAAGRSKLDAMEGAFRRVGLLEDAGIRVEMFRLSGSTSVVNAQSFVLFPLEGTIQIGSDAGLRALGRDGLCVVEPGETLRIEARAGEPFYGYLISKAESIRKSDPKMPPQIEAARPGPIEAPIVSAARGRIRIEWITIRGGSFMMGSSAGDERPAHEVRVSTFDISRTVVTFGQYRDCVRAGACSPISDDCASHASKEDDQPVVCVDWYQAKTFAEWTGGRLPSEAEWEYAARSGGKSRKFPWGDEEPTCDRAVLNHGDGLGCGRRGAWPVCSKPRGNTEQGLCDMAGNVWQWVQDWKHHSYVGAPADGRSWESPAGKDRVQRGGAWNFGANFARTTARSADVPTLKGDYIGFRVARATP